MAIFGLLFELNRPIAGDEREKRKGQLFRGATTGSDCMVVDFSRLSFRLSSTGAGDRAFVWRADYLLSCDRWPVTVLHQPSDQSSEQGEF